MAFPVPQHVYGLHGAGNTGGFLQNQFWACPYADFLLLKGRKTTTAPGDLVTIDGSHTFSSGFGFWQFDTDLDSGKLAQEMTKAFATGHKFKVEFKIAGNAKVMAEWSMMSPTELYICLFKEAAQGGKTLQFGEDGLQAQLFFKHDNGTNSEGKREWTCELQVVQHSMLYYEGSITYV